MTPQPPPSGEKLAIVAKDAGGYSWGIKLNGVWIEGSWAWSGSKSDFLIRACEEFNAAALAWAEKKVSEEVEGFREEIQRLNDFYSAEKLINVRLCALLNLMIETSSCCCWRSNIEGDLHPIVKDGYICPSCETTDYLKAVGAIPITKEPKSP